MPSTSLITLAWIAIAVAFASAAVILTDIYLRGYRLKMPIMEAVWPATALYFGPVAVWAYWRFGGTTSSTWLADHHLDEPPDKPGWATIATGVSHCGAGCTLGDIAAEFAVFGLGLTVAGTALPSEYIGDYILAVALGLIFQYLAIAPMRGLGFRDGMKAAAKNRHPLAVRLRARTVRVDGADGLRVLPRPPPDADVTRLLGPDADRNDHRLRHRLARQRLAHPPRHQRSHVTRPPRRGGARGDGDSVVVATRSGRTSRRLGAQDRPDVPRSRSLPRRWSPKTANRTPYESPTERSPSVLDMPKPTPIRRHPAGTAMIASIALLSLLLSACSSGAGAPNGTVTVTGPSQHASSPSAAVSTAPSGTSSTRAPATSAAQAVHIKTLNSDGATYGVGMPVIAYFSKRLTSAKALQAATTATVNGKPLQGAWFFEYSAANKGYPVEGHFRPQSYWSAHAKIRVDIPVKGMSAGTGLAFDNSLTLDFNVGARNITTVDDSNHTVTLVSDGKKISTVKTSLGDPTGRGGNKRTKRGIKVIMEKGRDISMRGPGYFDPHIKFTQRLTYDGEYLHVAPWNVSNINKGINTSNGCTNLLPGDAERLYNLLRIGDVVTYPNADGPLMQLSEGYGDWNVAWGQWQTGGLVTTS